MSQDKAEIAEVVRDYLDGLYFCDTKRLAKVFHPKALYATAAGDAPLFMTMDEYFPVVDKRDPPARRADPRKEQILSIELFGSVTALVTLECAFFAKEFIDVLTFIKVDDRWQIIAKVFHFDLVT